MRWEIVYQVHLDGKPTPVEVAGYSKRDAYKMLDNQWRLEYGESPPPKRRLKLVEVDRVRYG